jgi:hypothetical protein
MQHCRAETTDSNFVRFGEKGSQCAMPNLLHLNLSHSSLSSLEKLGLSPSIETSTVSCPRYVRHPDLRGNRLTSLSPPT